MRQRSFDEAFLRFQINLYFISSSQMNAMVEMLNAKKKAMAMQAKLLAAGANIQVRNFRFNP